MADLGFEAILPFLRPIEAIILDPDVSEIMVNAGSKVFVERSGVVVEVPGIEMSEGSLYAAIKGIARRLGNDVSEQKPVLDSRLPDGSRVAAVVRPCSVGGTTLAIRKFNAKHFTLEDLIENGTLTRELSELLASRVLAANNILISGGTSTGKTTLLNIVADAIPDEDRVIVIEDTAEIYLRKNNLVRLEARREAAGLAAVTIDELLRATLRLRPDRIIVGEVRGAEAFSWLQAANTGHSGMMCSIHANSARQAISRMVSCILMAGIELPYKAIKAQIGDCINLLVHIERRRGKRFVAQVLEIESYDPDADRYALKSLYERVA